MTPIVTAQRTHSLASVPPPESWRWHIVVFLGYLALGIAWTWPLVLHWQTGVIQKGDLPVDTGQGIWNLWWAGQAITQGQNPYLTRYLFYPNQINLFWQTLSLPNALLVFPVLVVSGPVVAFNLLVWLSFGLGGYATYRLVRGSVDSRPAALIAGFVFAFAPYHMQVLQGGPIEIISVQWIPLYVLMLMRALHRQTVGNTLGAAAALVVTTLASQYYGLFCAVYTLVHVSVAWLVTPERRFRLRTVLVAVAIAGIWCGALLPFAGVQTLHSVALEDWYTRQVFHSVALVDFVAPNVLHPVWGSSVAAWLGALHQFGVETGASPGVVVYALVIYGSLKQRAARPWLVLALAMAVLALGPALKITGTPTDIPLPFRLLDYLGPFRNSSRPAYFIAVMLLPVSVLVGLGLQSLQARLGRHPRVIATVAGVCIGGGFLVSPRPILTLEVDPVYAGLNSDPLPGAVIELPPRNDDSQYMVNQLCHGRPLAGGYLARTPAYDLVTYDSTLQRLWYAETVTPDVFSSDPAGELAKMGIRYIILHRDSLSQSEVQRIRRLLAAPGITAHADTGRSEIYRVDARAARPVLLPTAGWYPAESGGGRSWRWMSATASMRLLARSAEAVTLSLSLTAYAAPRPLSIQVNGVRAAEIVVPAAPEEQTVRLAFVVPPGENELTLHSAAQAAPDGRHLSVAVTRVTFSSTELPTVGTVAPLQPPTVLPALQRAPCR